MKNILISLAVLFSLNHAYAARVNLNDRHTVSDWIVYIDSDLAKLRPDAEKKGLPKLKESLSLIEKRLPKIFLEDAREKGLKIFITSSSKVGGRHGMFFVPKNNSDWSRNHERIMDNSIIIEYKSIFMKSSNFSYYLIHEFAHYYHLGSLGYANEYIWRKYRLSSKDPNYKATYAMNNHMEFFAELSAMFFMMPKDLDKMDKDGADLMRYLWGPKLMKSKIKSFNLGVSASPDWNATRKRNDIARKKLWTKK